jgi:hypothetical protein
MEDSFPAKLTFWSGWGGAEDLFALWVRVSNKFIFGGWAATGMRSSYGSEPKDGSTAQQYVPYYSAAQSRRHACDDEKRMDLPSSG